MDLRDIIYSYADERGFIAGICDALPLDLKEEVKIPFVNRSIKERTDPKFTMPECKSIIVVGVSYNKKVNIERDKCACGAFSLGACGKDYHIVIKEFLLELAVHLNKLVKFEYQIYVDTGPLAEREILYKAGLAWRGKNFCAVSDKLGSMFNCGYMLTDIDYNFFSDTKDNTDTTAKTCVSPLKSRCGGCTLCVDACPSGALDIKSSTFKYEKCISYLTQKKGELTIDEQKLLGVSLYGCDICQLACPYNIGKETGQIIDSEEIYPNIYELLSLDKRIFTKKYSERAFYWRGLNVIKRNARIVLENINSQNKT